MHVRKQRITTFVCGGLVLLFLACMFPFSSTVAAEKGSITGSNVNIRLAPNLNGQVIGQLNIGDGITITGTSGDWYSFSYNGKQAYIYKDLVKIVPTTNHKVKVIVNGVQLATPIEPPIKDGRVLVPFRVIGEALGVNVSWRSQTKQVIAIDQGKEVVFTINSKNVSVNGETIITNPAPYIIQGHTVLPLRLFAETFGADVYWDAKTKTVTINRVINKQSIAFIKEDIVPIFAAPSLDAIQVAQLTKGDRVKVQEELEDDWLLISYNDNQAYVRKEYVADTIRGAIIGIVNATELNIRSGPTVDAPVTGSLDNGERVVINGFDGNWAQIQNNGKTEYVHAFYLDLTRDNKPYTKLQSPVIQKEEGRDWLIWEKLGRVTSSHRLIAGGVEITTTALDADEYTLQHPAIKRVQYTSTSTGTKINIQFNPGYHFVVRHSIGQVRVSLLPSGLAGKRIVLDAGHGAHDPGAIGVTGLEEKSVILDVAQKAEKLLTAAGAEVIMTRSDDTFVSLAGRVEIAHQHDADSFISIHADSFRATSHGSTTFYYTGNPSWEQGKQLAEIAIKNITAKLGTSSRGADNKSLHVIRETEIPAILIELAFLSNPTEEKMLKTDSARQKAAEAIYDTLVEFYN